jgi:hypothetical protein
MKKQYFVGKFNQNFLLTTAGSDYLVGFFCIFQVNIFVSVTFSNIKFKKKTDPLKKQKQNNTE